MLTFRLLGLLIFLVSSISQKVEHKNGIIKSPSKEKEILRKLLRTYKDVGVLGRPVTNNSEVLVIKLGLELSQLLDLEENKKTLKTAGWLNMEWNDKILCWDPEEYNDVQELRIFSPYLWTPDIKLYNFADERPDEKRDVRAVVYADGKVTWSPQSIFKSTCDVEFTYFPFDIQKCSIEFISWTYDINKIDLEWKNGTTTFYGAYNPNPEWIMNFHYYSDDSLIPENEFNIITKKQLQKGELIQKDYRMAMFHIIVHRDPSLYIFVLILPSTLLSILTLVVFWLPPESSVKMLLGMNIFTAFFILLNLLTKLIPQSGKKFPIIGRYFCMNMVMITLSTFIGTLVTNLYFRSSESGCVPKILRRIIIDNIGRRLWIRQNIPLPNEKRMPNILKMKESKKGLLNKSEDDESPDEKTELEDDIRHLRKNLREYVRRQKEKSCKNMIAMEWRTLGSVLDRLFFFLYLIIMFLMILGTALVEFLDYLDQKSKKKLH